MATYDYAPISLQGKNVMVTGGTTGIGRSTAQALLQRGANVFIFGRHQKELDEAMADLKSLGKLEGITADQAVPEDVEKVFAAFDSTMGDLDILINNAAVSGGSILDSEIRDWKYVLDANLFGYMACCRLGLDRMQAKGEGQIVNVGSMSADEAEADGNVYVATKAAVRGFSESLRKQVNEMGIRLTLIEPGSVGTDMVLENTPVEEQREQQRQGKMLKAEDIAECICFALTQPWRCDLVEMQVRPRLQLI